MPRKDVAMDMPSSFGYWVRRRRKALDLTQAELARRVGCAEVTIQKVEADERRPSSQIAALLAEHLHIPPGERADFLASARGELAVDQLKDITRPEPIFQVVAPDLPSDFPPLKSKPPPAAPTRRSNLPTPPTPFVGRTADMAALNALLADPATRLVTITGSGGMGKTRLAIALAEQLLAANRFPDGVFFVSLAPVEAMDSIVSALAEALGFPLDAGKQLARSSRQQVFDYLREKRLLLILDNVEHLLGTTETGDAADLVAALLGNAPGVAILATSRERLKLHTEQVYLLGGLDMSGTEDPSHSSAVALFIQCARRLRPEFAPARYQFDVVARICHLVEGMPLAIELAAGWVDALALRDIAAEIEHGLDLLATALRDVPVRHRSMRAVFDASWRRLGAEQAVFARLAVFRGGGTRHAVQAVTQATLPQLHALVGASLVHYDVARDRYTIHELLRQYAAEQLAANPTEEHATRDRHAAYFCGLLHDLRGDLQGERQLEALATIEADGENVRAAWEWAARQHNVGLIEQAIESLGCFYRWQGRAEEGMLAYGLATAALANASGRDERRVRAQLLAWQAAYTRLLGERVTADALLAQSQELLNDPGIVDTDVRAVRAFVLLQAGLLAYEHDYPAARAAYEESRALFQALGDQWGEAAALFGLGAVALDGIGDYDLAQRYLLDSLALRRTLGDRLSMIETLVVVSQNARYRGQVAESERLARESFEIAITLANRRAVAIAGSNLGIALAWIGNYAESRRLLQETVTIYTDLGDRAGLANAYFRLGWSEIYLGYYSEAHATFERELSIARTIGATADIGAWLHGLAAIALAEGAYSEARRWGAEAISLLDAVGERYFLNLAHMWSALAERDLGNQREARRHVITALRSLLEQKTWAATIHALATIALLLADEEEPERAVEIYALTERENPFPHNSWSFAVYRRELAAIAAALPADVAAAAQTRGRERDLWATAEELLAELSAAGWDVVEKALEWSTTVTSTAEPPDALPPTPTNLPTPPTPLIGREAELATLGALLRRPAVRLITLTGVGGSGKTRLAIQTAAQLRTAFVDGVWFIDLAPLSDPELVIPTVMQTLGLKEQSRQAPLAQLSAYLREKQLLLVLDNFEQVLDAARHVAELLAAAPQVKVLITSRVVLHIRGEQEFEVPPLALPDPQRLPPIEALVQYAAVALFVARARDVRPEFALTAANAPAIAEICTRLDGLPLAIELAAARVKLFAPAALLARLERRLGILIGGPRDAPARQQTLRATIDWSYNLLSAAEQTLFARLGVFVGGCTLKAAEAVVTFNVATFERSNVLDGLASLVDQSLLKRVEGVGGEPRFTMQETIREYALERLVERGEANAIQDQHANCFLELAEEAEPWIRFMRPEREPWLARLEVEQDNLRAALEWFGEHEESELGLRLAGALGLFSQLHFHWREGREWLEAALAKSGNLSEAARAKALAATAHLSRSMGDFTTARAYAEQGLALLRGLGDKAAIAFALYLLGQITQDTGEYAMARACAEESLGLFDEVNDQWGRTYVLPLLGQIATVQGDVAQAAVYNEEILAFYRQLGYKRGIGSCLIQKGALAQLQGDWEQAVVLYAESLAICREIGHKWMTAGGLHNLGGAVLHQGDTRRAAACFAEGLALSRELGDQSSIAANLAGMAGVAAAQEQPQRSARLFGAADALFGAMGYVLEPQDRAEYDRNAAVARAQLGDEAFVVAWEAGRAMPIEQAIADALEALPEVSAPAPALPATPKPAVASAAYPAGLTAREVEVLRLVAQGLTDAQVAQRLVVSAHTVHAHLRSIYGKLEVTSRTAASRFAVDHHLI